MKKTDLSALRGTCSACGRNVSVAVREDSANVHILVRKTCTCAGGADLTTAARVAGSLKRVVGNG